MTYDCNNCGKKHITTDAKYSLLQAVDYFRKRATKFEYLASLLPDSPCCFTMDTEEALVELAILVCEGCGGYLEDKWADFSHLLTLRQAQALGKIGRE